MELHSTTRHLIGDHLAVCKCGGYKTIRHSQLVHTLRSILRESGASVAPREVEVAAWQRADGRRARLDVSFAVDGHRTFVDLTVRHPRAVKYLQQAAHADGAAAAVAEAKKRQRYPARPQLGLHAAEPFCVETFGRLGPAALRLLHGARQRAAEREEGVRKEAGLVLQRRWLALLSCSLQLSLQEAACAMWAQDGHLSAASGLQQGGPLLPVLRSM